MPGVPMSAALAGESLRRRQPQTRQVFCFLSRGVSWLVFSVLAITVGRSCCGTAPNNTVTPDHAKAGVHRVAPDYGVSPNYGVRVQHRVSPDYGCTPNDRATPNHGSAPSHG